MALESDLCLHAVDSPQCYQPITNFKASLCEDRKDTSHLYLPSWSLRISESAGMPFSAWKSLLVGWSLCPSSPFLCSYCQPDSLLVSVGASAAYATSSLSPSQLGARSELLEATALNRHSRRLWVRRWRPGLGRSWFLPESVSLGSG